ncbi:hypothetical protein ACLOJK_019680 [Asimina triloba]
MRHHLRALEVASMESRRISCGRAEKEEGEFVRDLLEVWELEISEDLHYGSLEIVVLEALELVCGARGETLDIYDDIVVW